MNRRLFGACGVLAIAAAVFVGGCKSDPLSDLDGTPAQLTLDFSHLQIDVGRTATVTATVLDGRSTPLPIAATFSSCNGVVTTVVDPTYHPIPATSSRAVITANSAAPSCVVVQAAGFTDTVTVAAVPGSFGGALSSTSPKGGDTLTISSIVPLKFDTAAVSVTFGGGNDGIIVSKSPDTVKVLVPFSGAAPLTIAGLLVTTYSPPFPLTLQTTATVTQTGDFFAPGDTGYASAPTIAVPTTTGDSIVYIVQVPLVVNNANCREGTASGATGKCTIFKYNATGTDSLQFTVNWTPATDGTTGASDVDIYSCTSAGRSGCFEEGGGGATAVTPETFTFKPAAGVHYLVIEQFTTPEDPNFFVTIKKVN